MGLESHTYYTTLSKINKIQNINSWYFFFNAIAYVYYLAQGGLSLFRTYTAFYFGQKNRVKFEKIWKKLFFYIFCFKYSCVILYGIFANEIAGLFTDDELTRELFVFLVRVYILISPIGLVYDFYSMLLNVIGFERIVFRISSIQFPFSMIFFGYLFSIYFGFGNKGLAFSFLFSVSGDALVVLWVFYRNIGKVLKNMDVKKDIELKLIGKQI